MNKWKYRVNFSYNTRAFLNYEKRPSMSRAKTGKGRRKVRVGETASRVVVPVYHPGQGQDERAEASHARPHPHWPRHGLDSEWSLASNPHQEPGTRWRAAADVGQARTSAGTGAGRQQKRHANRLADSVGAKAACTAERTRSALSSQR